MMDVDTLLSQAQRLDQAGTWDEAETAYRRLLEQVPDSGEIHFLLGCLFVRAGRPEDGVRALKEAARLLPQFAEPHIVLGNLLISLSRWSEAVEALARAVALRPDILPVKANLAVALYSTGHHAEAESLYKEILEGSHDNHDAHSNLAHVLNEQERFAEAEPHARTGADIAPCNAAALNILGNSLYGIGRLEDAEDAYKRAIGFNPYIPQAYLSLYNIYVGQERIYEAEQAARSALRLLPDHPHVLDMAARALMRLDRWDEAIDHLKHAQSIDPQSVLIVQRLAYAFSRKGSLEDAVAYGVKSVELDPSPKARFELAMDQLRTGRYREGWANLRSMEELTGRAAPQPLWDGSALNGRTLVVYAIAGLGDTIQFSRFLPPAAERANGTVIFECPPGLTELLADIPGVTAVVPQGASPYPADCYISLMALPDLLDATEETIPSGLLPMRIPQEEEAVWRSRLTALTGFKVGLCWGCSGSWEGRFRSIPLDTFAPLAEIAGLRLVSLQIGAPTEELHAGHHNLDILHVPEDLSTMTKTAALMRQLDLIISIDTSIAHLGGALGVETWVPIHFVPSPWWNVYRPNDTVWYPRHRLFRQPRRDDWQAVVERIRLELVGRVAA